MKIKEIFKVGDIMQSIDGRTVYLNQNDCVIYNKSRNEDAVILYLKRESDSKEGRAYLRVKDEFKSIENQLLNWAFVNSGIMGLTLNQLEDFNTSLGIEGSNGKLTLYQR